MNNNTGQQRLTAFYDNKSSERRMRKEEETMTKNEENTDFSDEEKEPEDGKMKEMKTSDKEEDDKEKESDVKEKKEGKREGKQKESPRRKQQKKGPERVKSGTYGNGQKKNTPVKNSMNQESDGEEETTPERNNHAKYRHVHVTRVTLKLTVQGQKDMKIGMMKMLKEYLVEMRKADSNIQIYPWKESHDRTKARIKTENDLTDLAAMQAAYGKGFFVYKGQGTMRLYPKVRIGHDTSIEDVRDQTKEWARANECNIFRDRLQFEKTTQVGWFCYTTRNFDTDALAEVISRLVGFQVDLQWRMVATGKKGKISEEQKTYALHVEVEDKGGQKYEYMNILLKRYGRNTGTVECNSPNGVRMRFVKLQRDAISTKEKEKLNRLRIRQKKFNSVILTEETEELEHLDYCSSEDDITLREMIMEIRSERYKDTQLFFSVDADWRGRGHVFSFSPKMEEEATIMIRTLLPYLKHKYPDEPVEEYFTEEAVERCAGLTVDPDTGRVKQLYEEEFDEEEEDEMLGFDLQIDTSKATAILTRPEKDRMIPGPEDDDSVSTLGGGGREFGSTMMSRGSSRSSKVNSNTTHPPQRGGKVGANYDDVSMISSTSTVTMQTIATLEAKLDENVSAINSKLNLLVSKLFNESEPSKTPASVPKTSSSRTETNGKAGVDEKGYSSDELQN